MAKYTGGGAGGSSGLGEAIGGFLGRGGERLGEYYRDKIKPKWTDDKGLFRGNPDGSGGSVMGTKAGLDTPDSGLFQKNEDGSLRLGNYQGSDINEGKGFLGEKKGLDKGFLGNYEGLDMTQDNKGFVQEGQFVNPWEGRYARGSEEKKEEFIGPTQPSNGISGAISETEPDNRNAPNKEHMVNSETGQNYGNAEVVGPLLAAKVSDPSKVPPEHAGTMQTFLNTQGYNLSVDGKWGPKSTEAMAQYMRKSGTGGDEFIGPKRPPTRTSVYLDPSAQVSTSKAQG